MPTLLRSRLVMAIAALLLVSIGLVGWLVNRPDPEGAYLRGLEASSIVFPSDEAAVTVGRASCDILAAEGTATGNVTSLTQWFTPEQAWTITELAVANFCPQYQNMVQ